MEKKILTLKEIIKTSPKKGNFLKYYLNENYERIQGPCKPVMDLDTGKIYPTMGLGYSRHEIEYPIVYRAVYWAVTNESGLYLPKESHITGELYATDCFGVEVAGHMFASCGELPLSAIRNFIKLHKKMEFIQKVVKF